MQLRRVFPLVVLALAACPSVDRQDPPANIAVATFDSATSTIPLPNDLALQRAPGLPAGLQRELLGSFVANGGWPADQEVAITIPVTVKARQPDGTYGTVCPGVPTSRCGTPPAGLDLATVSDENVALLRIDSGTPQRVTRCATPVTAECFEPAYANGVLSLRRASPDGSRRWPAGARYVVALRANALRTTDGLAIGADSAIALVAQNKDLSNRENQPPGGLPDSNGNGSNADETATIEALRGTLANPRAWGTVTDPAVCQGALGAPVPVPLCWLPAPTTALPSPFDAVATVFPRDQIASIQTFTVQPLAQVRPITDSGSGTIPLPSDFLLDPATGKVRNVPAFGPAAAGLATLDGFSTTAPLLIPLTGPVNATTISRTSARLYDLATGAPVQLTDLTQFPTPPQIVTQPPTTVSNGLTTTVVLAPAVPVEGATPLPNLYVPPLKEKNRYLVIVTNDVKDPAGQPLRRSTLMDLVFTFSSALCEPTNSPTCTSRIPGISNADAAGLQALRNGLGPVLDALNLRSCASNAQCAVLAYTVTTQSVKQVSVQLAAAPFSIEQGAGGAVFVPAQTAAFDTQAQFNLPAAAFPNVAQFVETTVPTLNAIQGSTGAFDPAFATWTPAQVQTNIRPLKALVAIPSATGPASGPAIAAAPLCPGSTTIRCVPLVVFHHGLNGARYQMLPIADSLAAKGFVVVAVDAPYHGDRALCAQSSDCVVAGGGDGVCTPNSALQTPSDTTAPGTCTTGTLRRNASLSTVASGNFFITSNFFRIRDGIRQDQLDHAALALALARPPAGVPQPATTPDLAVQLATTSGIAVDPREVRYAGISLGGIVGTSVVATNPRFKRAALNVPGGTLVDVFTNSPAFQSRLVPIFASLGVDLACVQAGTGCDAATRAAQTARFGQTLAIAKWVLDPADPVNYAANVATKVTPTDAAIQGLFAALTAGGVASTTTEAYGQLVLGDQVITNPYNRMLLNLATPARFTTYTASAVPEASRHGLLLANFTSPDAPAGAVIRGDLASFLETGVLPAPATTIP